ncbi:glycosyltransferase [Pseudomonas sp. P66]|jgi:cellulose synthase/poly-beta-1,6-N-acetylglucosamine synthase-like glycosyltransferase|uniref:Glycosyltransferase n=1 Tax=Pseudomonas arcuscaelestis TaxID=2710591 RepID=A0ABS2BUX2_9PSED|nr:glycosyltransferase [Pseudomonas arcuscaelestis]MBM3103748.1 glycosyltransferase [Pseudomonas arcuscaelestis]MBM3113575.1 glycosyltransferase [Pseudomonas arcuscaelestis]MBM5456756.1 glycosyltransferase [Pseudomonas arcuscaelestis]
MIAVIVPAHNEEQLLGACLQALTQAARAVSALGEPVQILVVLDDCSDASETIVLRHGVESLKVTARNVGHARRAGAALMLERGARWLSFTDADSCVPAHWLLCQLAFSADAVCGTVHVDTWQPHQDMLLRERYLAHYQAREGHRHIHGANLGICARAYQRVGGFQAMALDEDVQLVSDLQQSGAHIVWTARNSVATSSRRDCKVRGGFGDFLNSLGNAPAV